MFGWVDGMYVTEMRCAGWGEVRGFLGGASAFADSEMLPLRVFFFPKTNFYSNF